MVGLLWSSSVTDEQNDATTLQAASCVHPSGDCILLVLSETPDRKRKEQVPCKTKVRRHVSTRSTRQNHPKS